MAGKLSDSQYQQVLRDIQKRADRQREEDIRTIMDTEAGRRFIYWVIFDKGKLQDRSFTSGVENVKDGIHAALRMARIEGSRVLAIDLHNDVRDTTPMAFLTMMSEAVRSMEANLAQEQRAERSAEGA